MGSRYGRLFTEADVRKIVAMVGGPPDEADADAIIEGFPGTFPADEPLFLPRGQDADQQVEYERLLAANPG